MTFTSIDKRLVERKDMAFQKKYVKDAVRQTPDAADAYETIKIEHDSICLYKKKSIAQQSVQAASDKTA